MTGWLQDLRGALRMGRTHPGLCAAAVLSLALALGANLAIFTVWNAVMLRRLPVSHPDRLVGVFNLAPTVPGTGYMRVSHLDFLDYSANRRIFRDAYASRQFPAVLTQAAASSQVTVDTVSGNYFDVLGVGASQGRVFHSAETATDGAGALVVLSRGFFERQFGGNPGLIGSTIRLNATNFRVIGVAPAGFDGTDRLAGPDLWAPISMHRALFPSGLELGFAQRNAQFFSVVARLQPGVSVEQAAAAVEVTARRLAQAYPASDALLTATVMPLRESGLDPNVRAQYQRAFTFILLVVGLVLLVGCANVANLLLARAVERRGEMAVRQALGASAARLRRQLLTEALLLSLLAGALGLILARWSLALLWAHRTPALAQLPISVSLDARVIAWALGLTLLTTLLFGLAPALQASRLDPARQLHAAASHGGSRTGARLNAWLVAGETALALAALIVSGLFLASLGRQQATDPGFAAAHLAGLRLDLSPSGFHLDQPGAANLLTSLQRKILDRVRALPGVQAATLASGLPMAPSYEGHGYLPAENPAQPMRVVWIEGVAPGSFFRTMGLDLIEGRDFLPSDSAAAPHVMIVNQTMARDAWPGRDPIGQRVQFHKVPYTVQVVGVVRDSKYFSLTEAPLDFAYQPLAQDPVTALGLTVRAQGSPAAVLPAVERTVRSVAPDLALSAAQPAEAVIATSLWQARMGAWLLATLATLASFLALIGLYGVTAFSLRQRTRELGIRAALGANRAALYRLVYRQGFIPVLGGLTAGSLVALALGRLAARLLYGVTPGDPRTYALAAGLFVVAAAAALYFPARRAAAADPLRILREN